MARNPPSVKNQAGLRKNCSDGEVSGELIVYRNFLESFSENMRWLAFEMKIYCECGSEVRNAFLFWQGCSNWLHPLPHDGVLVYIAHCLYLANFCWIIVLIILNFILHQHWINQFLHSSKFIRKLIYFLQKTISVIKCHHSTKLWVSVTWSNLRSNSLSVFPALRFLSICTTSVFLWCIILLCSHIISFIG